MSFGAGVEGLDDDNLIAIGISITIEAFQYTLRSVESILATRYSGELIPSFQHICLS